MTAELGANHIETLETRSNLAVLFANTGQVTEAAQLIKDLSGSCMEHLGAEHELTRKMKTIAGQIAGLRQQRNAGQ